MFNSMLLESSIRSPHISFAAHISQSDPSNLSKDILPSLIRSAGAIVVNADGKRIFNELDLSKKMASALLHNCKQHATRLSSGREQPVAYVLINQEVTSHIERDGASILQHDQAGKSYGQVHHFCAEYGISSDELKKTFEEYERFLTGIF
jgi:hypothetical protein